MSLKVVIHLRLARRPVGTLVAEKGEVFGVFHDPVAPEAVFGDELAATELACVRLRLGKLALPEELSF